MQSLFFLETHFRAHGGRLNAAAKNWPNCCIFYHFEAHDDGKKYILASPI